MKIQIDTKNKTIKVEESVKLQELTDFLEKILPHEWQKFTLETKTVINNWTNPIYIQPSTPTYPNQIWTCGNGTDPEIICGTFNITT